MKKLFNKTTIIILISFSFIVSLFSYQNYISTKNDYSRFDRNNVAILNDTMALTNKKLTDIVNFYSNFYFTIGFDNTKKIFFPNNENIYFSVYHENVLSNINLNSLSFDTLEKLSKNIKNDLDNNKKISVTFNYDAIKFDKTIICDNLKYLEINDVEYLSSHTTLPTMTLEMTCLNSKFISFDHDINSDYYHEGYQDEIATYKYFQKFFLDVLTNKKYNEEGYFEVIDPQDCPIESYTITDENNKPIPIHVKVCFQKISADYSEYDFLAKTQSNIQESGYLVWYEYDNSINIATYNFFDYLMNNFYLYLISLVLIIITLLILNYYPKKILEQEVMTTKSEPDYFPENIPLDLTLKKLIENSNNLQLFKKITISYQLEPTIISSDSTQITLLLNHLYDSIFKSSHPGDNIDITLQNHILTITNSQSSFNKNELKMSLKTAQLHCYDYQLTEHKIIIKFNL